MASSRKWISAAVMFVFAVVICMTAVSDEKRSAAMEKDFVLQAHRGLSERYPENTLAAFQAAAEVLEYQGIETDVQETSDGVLVLFHDSSLKKRTDADGKIGDYTFEEVEQIHIDNASNSDLYPDEKIPVLEDFLTICREYGKIPYIELKSISLEGMKKLIGILDKGGWQDRGCVITTFVKEYLPQFRSLNESYPIEFMIDKDETYHMDEVIAFLAEYVNMGFRPNAYVITQEEADFCLRNGVRVEAYGLKVGDKEKLKKLKMMGVQGVTCNDYTGLQ